MSAEFLSVPFLDSCKKLLVVVSKLMGPSVQITAHIITLNGSDSANIRSALRSNQQELISPPQLIWSEGLNAETFQAIDNNAVIPLWL